MFVDKAFTKENLDYYLRELAKEFRRRNGTGMPAEIILVGGAAILLNYGFREMTYDIDAVIMASSAMKEAINAVGDRLKLPDGWLNTDMKKTDSYSGRLVQYSKYYRTYSNVLKIRSVTAEYLVAMKLMSGRRYKKDLSDIIGILYEQKKMGKPLGYAQIDRAVKDLYGGWGGVSDYAVQVLKAALAGENLGELFEEQMREEKISGEAVLRAKKYEGEGLQESSVDDIIKKAKERKRVEK